MKAFSWRIGLVALATVLTTAGLTIPTAANASASSLVAISGTLTQNGTGVPNVPVYLDDDSGTGVGSSHTTTASDGTYTLYAVSGDQVDLEITTLQYSSYPAMTVSSSPFTAGTQPMTEDIALPTAVPVTVSVADGDGNPLVGATIQAGISEDNPSETGQLSDGTPTTVTASESWVTYCTTDDSGQCSFDSPQGISDNIRTTYSPDPGDSSYPSFTSSTTTLVTDDPTSVPVTIANASASSLVAISGTLTQNGTGVPNVPVYLDDDSGTGVGSSHTTTASDGTYTLYAVSGDQVDLEITTLQYSSYPAMTVSSSPFTAGTQPMTEDIALPTAVPVTVSVADGDGNPLVGATIQAGISEDNPSETGQLSDGTPTTVTASESWVTYCTTDDSGQCSFDSPQGISDNIRTTYSPDPGDSSYPSFTSSTTTLVTDDPTSVPVTIANASASSLVAISGTLTQNGTGVPNVPVYLDDDSGTGVGSSHTTTASDGTYTLYAVSGDQVDLEITTLQYSSYPAMTVSSSPFTAGTQPMTEDIALPTAVPVTVSVADGDGNPLVGATIQAGISEDNPSETGQLSDGTPTTVTASESWVTYCTTDDSGQCSFDSPQGISDNIRTTYSPDPGDSSYPSFTSSTTTLVTDDPTSVPVTIANVASLVSAGTTSGAVYVASPGSTQLTDASTAPVSSQVLPPGTSAPVGAIGYKVYDLPVGGTIDVELELPPGTIPTTIDKLQNGQLINVTSNATITGNIVTLNLTDGGLGDADGVANGVIVDPVVPLVETTVPPPSFGITTGSLPNARPGTPYGPVTLHAAGLGVSDSPYTTTLKWKKLSLPKGLKLSSAGVLSGTPSKKLVAGPASVTVQVTETVTTRNGRKKVKTTTPVQATIPLNIS